MEKVSSGKSVSAKKSRDKTNITLVVIFIYFLKHLTGTSFSLSEAHLITFPKLVSYMFILNDNS